MSDFAAAAVLISFGAIVGRASTIQLILMTLSEVILFTLNECIGKSYLKVSLSELLVFVCIVYR